MEFSVVGSGPSGCLMAIYLAQQDHRVTLYERNDDLRNSSVPRGKSINLALSKRGVNALEEIGMAENLLKLSIPMRGRMIHPVQGQLVFQPYGKNDQEVIRSISRHTLNAALLDQAEVFSNIEIFFNQKCIGADLDQTNIKLENQSTGEITTAKAKVVIGADGAHSAIRREMLHKVPRQNCSQQFLSHGYKELVIPPLANGNFAFEENCLHIWPRHDFMMIALPNIDGSFTCTLFLPFEGQISFDRLKTSNNLLDFFNKYLPDALSSMPTLTEDFFTNPTGSMMTVRCFPWHYLNKFALVGDAAHAVVPFYGQGMNASFEDCSILNKCIKDNGTNIEEAFKSYEQLRKKHTDALSELAIENYFEMRKKVTSTTFLLKKKLDILLAKYFPNLYIPLYTMISFTLIPYGEAIERAKKQDRILLILSILFLIGVTCLSIVILSQISIG